MLTIDIGNSRIKWCRFRDGDIVEHRVQAYSVESFETDLRRVVSPQDASCRLMMSHVAGEALKKRLIRVLDENRYSNVSFAQTQAQQCGVRNSYEKTENMGVDRWLAMIAGFHSPLKQTSDAVCVVDCGTAITLDVVDSKGVHQGGLIMPGLQTMCASLVSGTSRIQADKQFESGELSEPALAASTEQAVKQGCRQLMLEGVSGIIARQKQAANGAMLCLVTGGDGEWVSEALVHKNAYEPFLVHYGLQRIADEGNS
ncbi:MAG TPA: type III pantothenate kinase [Gammaproteobacteria bacterium]|nr:type III pantothenate kinase [Gammaproteobacteria bacterium]